MVYIGALLVLFFFIFSLRGNEAYPGVNRHLGLMCGALVIVGLSKYFIVLTPNASSFFQTRELMVGSLEFSSLGFFLVFICLVVWGLDQIRVWKKTPLRPFK